MALDPMAQRAEGVSQLTPADLAGSVGTDGYGVNLPTTTYENPGATVRFRGVEANTNLRGSSIIADPTIQVDVADGLPESSEPFDTPDASGFTAAGTGDPEWGGADCADKNSRPMPPVKSAFDSMGETYPGNEMSGF